MTVRVGVSTARGAWDNIRGAAPGQRGGQSPGTHAPVPDRSGTGGGSVGPHVTVARLASPTAPLSLRHLPSRILFLCTDPRSQSIAFSPKFISFPPPKLHSAPSLALFGALCTQLHSFNHSCFVFLAPTAVRPHYYCALSHSVEPFDAQFVTSFRVFVGECGGPVSFDILRRIGDCVQSACEDRYSCEIEGLFMWHLRIRGIKLLELVRLLTIE